MTTLQIVITSYSIHYTKLYELDVGDQGIGDRTDAAVVDRSVAPGNVGILGIDGAADDLHPTGFKFFDATAESD